MSLDASHPPLAEPAARPDLCTCMMVRQVSRHLSQHYDRCLAPAGITITQYAILSRLKRHGSRRINQLAAELVMDRTTLGRLVQPLERDGLVRITASPPDRRARTLSLTPAGLARQAEARFLWDDAQDRFNAAYGPERARQLGALLAGIATLDLSAGQTPSPEELP